MKSLYIIGNGFDVAHGLRTEYWKFREYLESTQPYFLNGFETLYDIQPLDGSLLLYKRMEAQGRFRWPRNSDEVRNLTWQQFDWLMSGLEIEQPKAFRPSGDVDGIPYT